MIEIKFNKPQNCWTVQIGNNTFYLHEDIMEDQLEKVIKTGALYMLVKIGEKAGKELENVE